MIAFNRIRRRQLGSIRAIELLRQLEAIEGRTAARKYLLRSICDWRIWLMYLAIMLSAGAGGAAISYVLFPTPFRSMLSQIMAATPVWILLWVGLELFLRLWSSHLARRVLADHPTWCSNCGYDLRATPDRCPECGQVVE